VPLILDVTKAEREPEIKPGRPSGEWALEGTNIRSIGLPSCSLATSRGRRDNAGGRSSRSLVDCERELAH
jgi:hypothetical protein